MIRSFCLLYIGKGFVHFSGCLLKINEKLFEGFLPFLDLVSLINYLCHSHKDSFGCPSFMTFGSKERKKFQDLRQTIGK